ncbi:hypothetical protein [uncultured Deinococcus sp.]|uniref:hypothetical protein n=1 Tax=uncultured Deinococcus sp. TaxID=158789 RepID=UPI0025D23984|nr:hypothetical protein [uncultured Deinococcus sp.]
MKDSALSVELLDALALDWLYGHHTPVTLQTFAHDRGRPVADVRHVLLELQLADTVMLRPMRTSPPELQDITIVLTRRGQCAWVKERAEQALPGVHAQLQAARQVLRRHPGVSEDAVAQHLALSSLQVRQVVLMLRCLHDVHAALDAQGRFTDLRLREPKT